METKADAPAKTPAEVPEQFLAKAPATKPAKHPWRVATGKKVAERNRVALEQKKNQETPAAPAKQRDQKVDRKRQR